MPRNTVPDSTAIDIITTPRSDATGRTATWVPHWLTVGASNGPLKILLVTGCADDSDGMGIALCRMSGKEQRWASSPGVRGSRMLSRVLSGTFCVQTVRACQPNAVAQE